MPKFIIEFQKIKAKAILEYNTDGCLINYQHEGEWKEENFVFFFQRFPFMLSHIDEYKLLPSSRVKVIEVAPDVSFDRFWNEFDYKHGKKPAVKKTWENLTDGDKILALAYIPSYKTHLAMNPGQSSMYPQSYLNAKPWENN